MATETPPARQWPRVARPVRDRLLERVVAGWGGCWMFTRPLTPKGYGILEAHLTSSAHRAAYIEFIGPIPDGFQIDHLCRTPRCVNPWHLEAVTPEENRRRIGMPRVHVLQMPSPQADMPLAA